MNLKLKNIDDLKDFCETDTLKNFIENEKELIKQLTPEEKSKLMKVNLKIKQMQRGKKRE